jgi:hypothetical protein
LTDEGSRLEPPALVPNDSTGEILYFDPIEEDRGSYFVKYQPPVSNNPFAKLKG